MKAASGLLLLLALSACGDRRTFDERYQDTSKTLEDKARQLDENLADKGELNQVNNAAAR